MAQKSKFQYVTAKTDNEKIKFSIVCIDNHLYVDGWTFLDWLSWIEVLPNKYEIGICFCDNLLVGCSIINPDGQIGFFVKEEYRRMGIATKLCEVMRSATQQEYLYAGLGQGGSDKFFEWVDIPIDEMY